LKEIEKRVRQRQFISGDSFGDLLDAARDAGLVKEALDLAITQFGGSNYSPMADGYFTSLIIPSLKLFTKDQLAALVKVVNSNKQIYGRTRARKDHRLIKEAVDEAHEGSFDFKPYPQFVESLGEAPKPDPEPA
jgi:hypothetical protein